MVGLVIFIIGVLMLPFLCPEATIAWLRQTLHHLEERRAKRERENAHLDSMYRELMAWDAWVVTLHRQLPHTHSSHQRHRLLTQALAAGQRYLQNADPRECPELVQKTERICQGLQQQLNELTQRSTKNGAKPCDLAPRFSG